MTIFCSVARSKDLRNPNGENYVYLRAQSEGKIELEELAKYASKHYAGRLSNHEIIQALDAVKESVVDYIKEGYQVNLGNLGTLYPHITSNCIPESEFQARGLKPAHDIKEVTVKWKASKFFKEMAKSVKFDFKVRSHVLTRKAMLKQGPQKPEE